MNGAAPITCGLLRAPARRSRASRAARCRRRRSTSTCEITRQHAVAHFLLEAVHHRQHDDQRRHAERDAGHRDAGDEGDEAVAAPGAAGARVAPADLQFVGPVHGGRCYRRHCGRVVALRRAPDNRAPCTCSIPFASALLGSRPSTCCAICRLPNLGAAAGRARRRRRRRRRRTLAVAAARTRAGRRRWGWRGHDGRLPFAARAAAARRHRRRRAAWGLIRRRTGIRARPRHAARPGRAGARRRRVARAVRRGRDAVRERRLRARAGARRSAGTWRTTASPTWPAASLDRVIGRNVDRWLADTPGARAAVAPACAALQSEVQMLLHTPPAQRTPRGAGRAADQLVLAERLRPRPARAAAERAAHRRAPARRRCWPTTGPRGPRPGTRSTPAPIAALLAGAPTATRCSLTLCGERSARSRFDVAAAHRPWQRLRTTAGARDAPHAGAGGAVNGDAALTPCCDRCATCRRAPAGRSSRPACTRCSRVCLAARGVRAIDELDDALGTPAAAGRRCSARDAAARLLADAIAAGSRICIVADYDCDGATACAVALRGLRCSARRPALQLRRARPRAARLRADAGDRRPRRWRKRPRRCWSRSTTASPASKAWRTRARAGSRCWSPTTTCRRVDGARRAARRRRDRQPEPARLRLREQEPRRRRRDVLRAAGAARRAARARRVHAERTQPRLDALLDLVALGTVADVVRLDAQQPPPRRAGPASASAPAACSRASPRCSPPPGATPRAPAPSTSASRSGRASTPPGGWPT